MGALGQIRERTSECALLDRLHDMESELSRSGGSQEAWELLDRLCASLARHGSNKRSEPSPARLRGNPPPSAIAMARIENLGWIDLSVDPEQLSILLQRIRELTPRRSSGSR
jgi:hypothetical protein